MNKQQLLSETIKRNDKTAVINERESMFGSYDNYFSVRLFDVTGTVQRNFNTKEDAMSAINLFLDTVIEFKDTIEFYKSYNIYEWVRKNIAECKFETIAK